LQAGHGNFHPSAEILSLRDAFHMTSGPGERPDRDNEGKVPMNLARMGHASAWHRGVLCALIGVGVLSVGCASAKRAAPVVEQDEKEGATGTRAKGEDGKMGDPTAPAAPSKPQDLKESQQFGIIGRLSNDKNGAGGPGHGQNAPPPPPMQNAARLDPNARYATTYRPGGAALAAFDAALARGAIPVANKDLVGDFGARYAPAIAKPTNGAMSFQVDTERGAVGPNGGPLNLRIAMRSTDAMPSRAQLSVHLVLDVSGSMQGMAIDNARKAAEALVERLDPSDDFSMVTFSNEAKVLVSDGVIGPRRSLVLAKIHDVKAEGGTNISAGLDLGYAQAHTPSIKPDAVKIVMFLSDGHANAGDTRASSLAARSARAFQDGIQTSSFGLGADFDAPLMSGIADRGAGGYYYLADSSQIAPALAREFDSRLVPVAQAIEVRVRLRPDIVPTKVFGSQQLGEVEAWAVRQQELQIDKLAQKKDQIKQDRQDDAQGGMRFFIPAFARDDRHAMLLTLQLPAGSGERPIASIEIRYKDRITKQNVTREIAVTERFAASDEESATTANASVQRTVQAFAAGDAIMQAADLVDHGDRPRAARLLDERAELLRRASDVLHEPMLADEATRVARLSGAIDGTSRLQDPLPLAILLRGSSYGYLR
jgi:Ca-activated chloride channel family protein